MQSQDWHIGCSGFYYKEWKEVFYPKGLPQARWFEYYSEQFSTLEINNTFYRFPELKTLQSWYRRSPVLFTFSVKAPKIITHQKVFREAGALLDDFYAVISDGLKEKLGPVLFQLPPHLGYSDEKLDEIIHSLNPSFLNVVEFRHESWWRPEVYARLRANRITFCGISYPGLSNDVISNTPLIYYRFHGIPRLYYSDYDESFIRRVFELIHNDPKARSVYVYFNNTAEAAALGNARYMMELAERS